MLTFKIKGIEYEVKEPTIKDYYSLQKEIALQDANSKMNIVSQLSGCAIKQLKLLDKHQFLELWNVVVTKHLDIPETAPFHRNFILNGKFYGFLDMDNVSLGEFVDMDVLSKDPQSQKKLHLMMAILYRPAIAITEKWMKVDDYDSETLSQRAEEFLDMPLKYVTGSLNFFLQVSKFCYESMLDSLIQQTKKTELTEIEKEMVRIASQLISELLETGTTSSISSQEKTLQNLTQLQNLALLASSTTLDIEKINKEKKKSFVNRMISKIKSDKK